MIKLAVPDAMLPVPERLPIVSELALMPLKSNVVLFSKVKAPVEARLPEPVSTRLPSWIVVPPE